MKDISQWRQLLSALTLVVLAVAMPAQATNYWHPTENIVEIATAADDFDILVAALEATGLDAALADESGHFTVFAPTDAAFNALGAETIKALLADPEALSDILLYHVLDRSFSEFALRIRNGRSLHTLNGEGVDISASWWYGDLFINQSKIVVSNIRATNGIIHVIDAVLLPPTPQEPLPNIVETAIAAGGFTTLVAALQATGLDQALADENGTFTVFAPTDDAFAALGQDTIDNLLANPDALSDILLYHALDRERSGSKLSRFSGRRYTTLNHDKVVVNVTDEGLYINQSLVDVADIQTSNGIIHVIDRVLLPPNNETVDGTIVDVAVQAGNFTTLVAALQATGLDVPLANPHYSFTVFAPTDEAFAALGQDTINELLANPDELADILLYHVDWPARDTSRLLRKLRFGLRMLNRDRVALSLREGDLFVNDAKIVVQDIVTDNGVIHVIDAVLIPPSH